jgi:hypothetical protein
VKILFADFMMRMFGYNCLWLENGIAQYPTLNRNAGQKKP